MNVCEWSVCLFLKNSGTSSSSSCRNTLKCASQPNHDNKSLYLEYKCLMCNLLFTFSKACSKTQVQEFSRFLLQLSLLFNEFILLILANSCSNFTCIGFLDNILKTERMWRRWVCVVHHEGELVVCVGFV